MKEFVFLSGKGGTGKTSIAASMAVLAGKEAIIADCDVDAANMHILMKPDFKNSTEFFSGELAVINHEICTMCGKCEEVCRFKAISQHNSQYHIDEPNCEGCGYCELVCPEKAILMEQRKSGTVHISGIRTGSTMVHARLEIAGENSGKLVARVKQEATRIAKEGERDYILVDGPPGIGCPVISSLSGASFTILVTEPTNSGFHDLTRIHKLIKRFNIPSGCIINKSDLNKNMVKEIKEYLIEEGIFHLADIPYDDSFIRSMVNLKTVIEINPDIYSALAEIWTEIKQLTKN
jgi:MinD superfamily P-loop ATPase